MFSRFYSWYLCMGDRPTPKTYCTNMEHSDKSGYVWAQRQYNLIKTLSSISTYCPCKVSSPVSWCKYFDPDISPSATHIYYCKLWGYSHLYDGYIVSSWIWSNTGVCIWSGKVSSAVASLVCTGFLIRDSSMFFNVINWQFPVCVAPFCWGMGSRNRIPNY